MEREMQWQCMPHCRSQDHGTEMAAAITCGTPHQVKTFILSHCLNPFHIMDAMGRNLLHVAASCGKLEVMEWLLENGADIRVKDKESGWTPLHRSLFYGQISCAIHLIRHGASTKRYDKEELTPLELIMKDTPAYVSYDSNNPTQAYTWGSNSNFNLGHGQQRSREHPELVDTLVAHNHSIKQVVMCKFHTLFLTHGGRVLSCGHGHGGRLGLGDETTCLRPQVVKSLGNRCKMVAGARDHSLFLMESGIVMSCGDNNYLQLGHSSIGQKCPVPKNIASKTLKNRNIIGIVAGRFHSVIYTKDAVFTFGLNAGQLGHNKGEEHIPTPRQVTSLCHPNIIIRDVAASDAATVCLTKDGDIYVLHEYQCRKVASNHLSVNHVAVVGGYLDAELAEGVLCKQGGEELQLLALHSNGKVFSWGKSDNSWRQCMWTHRRPLSMLSVAFNENNMVFITAEGEGYQGKFINKKSQGDPSIKIGQQDKGSRGEQNIQMVSLERLPVIHRATGVACDPQGRNFVVLQSDPRTSLTELPECSDSEIENHLTQLLMEADSTDLIHDVLIKIDNHRLSAHKFILASASEYFAKLFASPDAESNNSHEIGKLPHFPTMSNDGGTCTVDLTGIVDYDVFRLLMQYIYTATCDVFLPGFEPQTLLPRQNEEANSMTIERGPVTGESYGMEELTINERNRNQSAFSVYRDQEQGKRRMKDDKEEEEGRKKGKRGKKKGKGGQHVDQSKSKTAGPLAAVRLIVEEAKKFGMKSLAKRLENVKCLEGRLVNFGPKLTPLSFHRMSHSHLCDVELKSEEGTLFPAHKCILTARLDYFNNMLGSGWMEASTKEPLKMAVPAAALVVLLDFLYTDQAQKLHASQDLELLCNTLTIADQFFVTRLKDMCELALADLITLRNVSELLHFASIYQAMQLKATCHQFICLNLACLIEAGSLDSLDDDILEELSVAYKATLPYCRFITPSTDCPDLSHIEPYPEGDDVTLDGTSCAPLESKSSSTSLSDFETFARKAKAKRKGRRRTSSTGKQGPSSMCESGDDSAPTGNMSFSEEMRSPAGAHCSNSCSDLPPSRSASISDGMSDFPQTTSSENLGNLGNIEDGTVLSFSSKNKEKGVKKKKGQAAMGDRFLATDFPQTTSPEDLGANAQDGIVLSSSPGSRDGGVTPAPRKQNKDQDVGDKKKIVDEAGSEQQWTKSDGGDHSKSMAALTVKVHQDSEKDEPIPSTIWGRTSPKSPVMDFRDIMQAQSGMHNSSSAHTRTNVTAAQRVTMAGSYPITSPGEYPTTSPGKHPTSTGKSSIISPSKTAVNSVGNSAIISPTRTRTGGQDQAPTVSPTQRPSGGKGPNPMGKKSQKQRKREQQQAAMVNASGGMAGASDKSAGGQVPVPAQCPWAKLTSPSSSRVSFRDLQAEDEKTASLQAGASSSPAEKRAFAAARKISFGLAAPSNQRSTETEKATGPATSPESPKEAINPWQRVGATSPPAPSVSFSDIIKAESEQRENLDKARKKSLAQIQIEERAMEQLMSHYHALDKPDEYITVERVHCIMATPLWKKKDDQ